MCVLAVASANKCLNKHLVLKPVTLQPGPTFSLTVKQQLVWTRPHLIFYHQTLCQEKNAFFLFLCALFSPLMAVINCQGPPFN